MVIGFALIILAGAGLLTLPVSAASGVPTPFLDALFTATSATCVTGLAVVDTGTHWSLFGKIVIISLIQVGGLGFMTMATLFAFALNKRLSLKERLILQEAMNQGSMEGIVRLIRKVLVYSLTIEFTAAVIFAIRWSFDLGPVRALGYGVFHAISFFNNAGFDLFGPITGQFSSITAYADDYVINIVSMALIILGGIGFVVLSDLMEYKQRRRLSLHSKVVLSASGILILVGAIVIFIFEFTNPKTLATLNWNGKILASFFQSVSPRTAGANSIDIAGMRQATQFFSLLFSCSSGRPRDRRVAGSRRRRSRR